MKITFFSTCPYMRHLRQPLVTSRAIMSQQGGAYLGLLDDNGRHGYGEMAGENDNNQWSQLTGLVDQNIPEKLSEISDFLDIRLPGLRPAYRFAVETALSDLAAKKTNKPLSRWLNRKCNPAVPVNCIISTPPDDLMAFADEFKKCGYETIKVKVGHSSLEEEIRLIAELRSQLGENIEIRLDANRGLDFETALAFLSEVNKFNISYIEEPLSSFNPQSLTRLHDAVGIRIALDESLIEQDYNPILLDKSYCQVAIIKPSLSGGLYRTQNLVDLCRKEDIEAVLTSNLETEIGIVALLHLAAAIKSDLPMGINTMRLFENPHPELIDIRNGHLAVPNQIGLGDWSHLCPLTEK